MIRSMTAYARREIKSKWGNAIWELRSVNQRYMESYIRLPEQFRGLEPVIREHLRSHLARGKIECTLFFTPNPDTKNDLIINEALAKKLVAAANWVKMQSDEGEIDPLEVLRWPGVIAVSEQDLDSISGELIGAFNATIDDFIQVRETEGKVLKTLIEQRLAAISDEISKVRANMPEIMQWQRERLTAKLEEARITIDRNRVEQEVILIAQRLDVAEEMDRLQAHVNETYNILNKQEAVGRRLDFMMQEFNRESNTLASKSINTEVTNSAIELKVLIEQMREQIQNIE